MSQEARMDIKWWHDFLPEYNGVSLLSPELVLQENIFETDATLKHAGGTCDREYFMIRFPEEVRE